MFVDDTMALHYQTMKLMVHSYPAQVAPALWKLHRGPLGTLQFLLRNPDTDRLQETVPGFINRGIGRSGERIIVNGTENFGLGHGGNWEELCGVQMIVFRGASKFFMAASKGPRFVEVDSHIDQCQHEVQQKGILPEPASVFGVRRSLVDGVRVHVVLL